MSSIDAKFTNTGEASHWLVYVGPANQKLEAPTTSMSCQLPQGVEQGVLFFAQGAEGKSCTLTGTTGGRNLFPPRQLTMGESGSASVNFNFTP
jgi:hypothetical protein